MQFSSSLPMKSSPAMSAGFYNPLIVCGFIFYICYTLVDISTSKNPDQTQDRDRWLELRKIQSVHHQTAEKLVGRSLKRCILPGFRDRPSQNQSFFCRTLFRIAEFNRSAHCRINSFNGAIVAATRRAVVCTVPYGSSSLPMAT